MTDEQRFDVFKLVTKHAFANCAIEQRESAIVNDYDFVCGLWEKIEQEEDQDEVEVLNGSGAYVVEPTYKTKRRPKLNLLALGIQVGDFVETTTNGVTYQAKVLSARHVEYEGVRYMLSPLTRKIHKIYGTVGPAWNWSYNGKPLGQIRDEMGI